MTMHFSYDGFTQHEGTRSFIFRGVDTAYKTKNMFCLDLDVPLFTQNRIPMQEGPMLCLQLLQIAYVAGPTSLERFRHYQILPEDVRPFLVERARAAAEKALKAPRRPFNQKQVVASDPDLRTPPVKN